MCKFKYNHVTGNFPAKIWAAWLVSLPAIKRT